LSITSLFNRKGRKVLRKGHKALESKDLFIQKFRPNFLWTLIVKTIVLIFIIFSFAPFATFSFAFFAVKKNKTNEKDVFN
jgi:hypothetical protein